MKGVWIDVGGALPELSCALDERGSLVRIVCLDETVFEELQKLVHDAGRFDVELNLRFRAHPWLYTFGSKPQATADVGSRGVPA